VSGASGVELYSFDLTTNTLKSLGTLAGVTDLVGLSLLSEVQAAETTAKAQRPSATFSVPASDNAAGKDAQNDGVTIAGNTVKIDLVEAQNVTNGKLVVTFDPGKLTFQSITGAGTLIAVNDSMAAEGKLIIAYAAGSAISAGDVLASLVFAYEGEYVTTQVTISAEQRNELDSVTEDATVVVIDNYVPSADNTLKDLSVEEGTLTPAFDSNVTEYTVQVPYEVEKLTVLATLNDERAAVVISDTALTDVGTVVITVTVTAENGDVKVYTITATRNACTHQHTEIIPGKAPTCTETGLTEGKKCTVCGETLVAQEVLPANGHTEETIPGKAPTCTETGLTEGKKCTVCGETLVAQDEIPATEHYFEHGFCVDCGAPGGSPTTGDPMVAVLCAVVFSGLGMALVIRKKKD
ncbi:MAG: cadherin-like beta sandwich domain-containing protein, partial [Ruminococcaceae bacterium]|nr:cadherin-like beta sandwich domain-containing protein [Oscillospiraceae bacterium]